MFNISKYLRKVKVHINCLFRKIFINILYPLRKSRIHWTCKLLIYNFGKIDLGKGASIQEHTAVEIFKNGHLSIGTRTAICRGSILFVLNGAKLSIGNNSYIGEYNNIRCTGKIRIGDNVRISQLITITDGQYNFSDKNRLIGNQGYQKGKVIIGDDVWVGSNSVILPGVKIGNGVVVGAGSVITKNIPDYAVVVGNPARVIKYRM